MMMGLGWELENEFTEVMRWKRHERKWVGSAIKRKKR